MSRTGVRAVRGGVATVLLTLVGVFACGEQAARAAQAALGYGKCSKCSCPGFSGSGWSCWRGGCGHHYDSHW